VEGWRVSKDLELKIAGEAAATRQWSLQVFLHPFVALTVMFSGPAIT